MLGRPPGTDARGLSRPQSFQVGRRGKAESGGALAQGRGKADRVSAVSCRRQTRPHRALGSCAAARTRGFRAGGIAGRRRRHARGQQPALSLPHAGGGLDGRAVAGHTRVKPRGKACSLSIPVLVISTISPVCTPALPSRVTTFGWMTTV